MKCRQRGEGGSKIPKFCGRRKWMAPFLFLLCLPPSQRKPVLVEMGGIFPLPLLLSRLPSRTQRRRWSEVPPFRQESPPPPPLRAEADRGKPMMALVGLPLGQQWLVCRPPCRAGGPRCCSPSPPSRSAFPLGESRAKRPL